MRLALKIGAVLLAGALCGGPVDAGMVLSAAPAAGGAAPVNTAAPQMSGALATVGNTLTCSSGTWANSPTSYTYQFFRDGVSLGAASSTATHSVVSADQNHLLTCVTTATNGSGTSSASPVSNPTGNCTQSSAFFARVWALPATLDGTIGGAAGATNHLTDYDVMICGLQTDGILARLDALWVPATADATSSSSVSQQIANLNLVSSSYTLVLHPGSGTPVFTANAGYTGGAEANTTVWIDTGYNPATAATGGGQYQFASAHLMGWTLVDYHSTGYAELIGGAGPSNSAAILPWTSAVPASIIADVNYQGSNFSFVNSATHSLGSTVASRTGTSTLVIYRNGVAQTLGGGPFADTGNPNANIYMLAGNNNNGTIVNGGPYQISAASVGAGLTATQISSGSSGLHQRLCAYLTAVHGSC